MYAHAHAQQLSKSKIKK